MVKMEQVRVVGVVSSEIERCWDSVSDVFYRPITFTFGCELLRVTFVARVLIS